VSTNVNSTGLTFCIDTMSSTGNPVNAPTHLAAGVFLSLKNVVSDSNHDAYTFACAG